MRHYITQSQTRQLGRTRVQTEPRAQRMVRTGHDTWDIRPLRACPNSLPACSLHTALTQLSHLCLSARSLSHTRNSGNRENASPQDTPQWGRDDRCPLVPHCMLACAVSVPDASEPRLGFSDGPETRAISITSSYPSSWHQTERRRCLWSSAASPSSHSMHMRRTRIPSSPPVSPSSHPMHMRRTRILSSPASPAAVRNRKPWRRW